MNVADKWALSRQHLMETHDFIGAITFQFKDAPGTPTPTIPTAETDGTYLHYNPSYIATLTQSETTFVYAHETLHPALEHPWRTMAMADHDLANQAADYIVNGILIRDHVGTPPKGILYDQELSSGRLDFEQVYGILMRNKREEQQTGQPSGKPGQSNGPQSSLANDLGQPQEPDSGQPGQGDPSQPQPGQVNTPADWQMAVDQACLVANKWGTMPANAKLAIDQTRKPREDWRAILANFIEQHATADYSWAKPNRRFLAAADLYLPGIKSDQTPPILIYVDTSGSVGTQTRTQFAAHVQAVATDCQPERIVIAYADTDVQHVQEWTPGSGPLKLDPMGGGGTAFGPALARQHELCPDACCVIYLTDADGEDNDTLTSPAIPVLWALAPHATRRLPFGRHITIKEN